MVRCVMFEYVSRPQSLPKYAGEFLSLKKVKIKPGRPRGRQKLEAVMSKYRIRWKIVEEEEPWGRQQQRFVMPPVFAAPPRFIAPPIFVAPPGFIPLIVGTPMITMPAVTTPMSTTSVAPMAPTPTMTTPPVTTPPLTTSEQLPPTTKHQPQATAQEDICQCRDVNRYLQPPLQRLPSRHCSCNSTRIIDVDIEENLDTLADIMQTLQI